jgi:RimJ/RimL family protein N-acetyltransferase
MTIPVLETERLILRAHRAEDFAPFMAMWADESVTRYIGGKAFTEEESWSRYLRNIGQWEALGFGFWAVEEKATRRFIGQIGYVEAMRAIEPSLKGVPEIGWSLAPDTQGKGYGLEGARAAVAWGEKHFGGVPIRCIIDPGNAPSIRLAARLGFAQIARTVYKGAPIVLFERKPQAGL